MMRTPFELDGATEQMIKDREPIPGQPSEAT